MNDTFRELNTFSTKFGQKGHSLKKTVQSPYIYDHFRLNKQTEYLPCIALKKQSCTLVPFHYDRAWLVHSTPDQSPSEIIVVFLRVPLSNEKIYPRGGDGGTRPGFLSAGTIREKVVSLERQQAMGLTQFFLQICLL